MASTMPVIRTTDAGKADADEESIKNVNDNAETTKRNFFTELQQIKVAESMDFTNVSFLVAPRHTDRM